MTNEIVNIIQKSIIELTTAINLIKEDAKKVRAQFKLIKFEDNHVGRKKKLPKGVRTFKEGLFQARKQKQGIRYIGYGKTPEEALLNMSETLTIKPSNKVMKSNINSNSLFIDWLNEWVTVFKLPKLSPSGLYQINNVIKRHIPAWLKELPLKSLTPILIEKALNEVDSLRMREYAYIVYNDSISKAFMFDYIPDIMRKVTPFRSERKKGKPLSYDDQAAFIKAVDGLNDIRLKKLYMLYLFCGARPGEALKLKASNFDFSNDLLYIPGTKNKYSKRSMPLLEPIKQLVSDWLPTTDTLLFPFTVDYVSKLFNKLISGYTLKDLRHTFATRCKESGIPTDVYKQWLGHAKGSKVAETTYTDYSNVHKIEAVKFKLNPKTEK